MMTVDIKRLKQKFVFRFIHTLPKRLCCGSGGVVEVAFAGGRENFVEIAARGLAGSRKIHVGVIAAVAGRRAGHLPFVASHKLHRLPHEFYYVGAPVVTLEQQVVTGAASHRSPVDHLRGPLRVIAQERGCKMLHGMEGTRIKGRLPVRTRHAYVERGYDIA